MRALVLLVALLGACSPAVDAASPADSAEGPTLRIATGPDAETELLAHVMAQLVQEAGLGAELVPFSDAEDSRQALELGAVDLRIGYTGEAWLEVLGRPDPPGDPLESIAEVHEHDLADGILWLRPRPAGDEEAREQPPANATFAFAVMGPPGADADLRTVSELATRLSEQPEARVCVDAEFGERHDGLRAVLRAYSVRSDRRFVAASPEEAVVGVATGDCLAGLVTRTDGMAFKAGLQPLVDDLQVFPAFVPLPQVRMEATGQGVDVRRVLAPLSRELTSGLLAHANAAVARGRPVDEVAAELATELQRRAGAEPSEDASG